MKKFLAVVLSLVSVLCCFVACNEDDNDDKNSSKSSSSSDSSVFTDAIDNYFDYYFHTDINKVESLAPKAYWEYCKETGLIDISDEEELEKCYEDYLNGRKEELYEFYGGSIKYSYKVTGEKDLSTKKLNTIKKTLNEKYNISKNDIKAAKEIDFHFLISGKDYESEDEAEGFIVVKIGNGWYLLEDYDDSYYFLDNEDVYDWNSHEKYLAEKESEE